MPSTLTDTDTATAVLAAARVYLGECVELRYRLPRLFARVIGADLPEWRARMIARHTIGLSVQAAGFVDTQVAGFAHTKSAGQRRFSERSRRSDPPSSTG